MTFASKKLKYPDVKVIPFQLVYVFCPGTFLSGNMPGQEVVSSYSSQLMLGCPSSIWGTRIEIVTVLCSILAS